MNKSDINSHKELASISRVNISQPNDNKKVRIEVSTDTGTYTLNYSYTFSDRSNLGRAFLFVTGIKPSDFSGADPLSLMLDQSCYLLLKPTKDGKSQKAIGLLSPPSPQIKIGF